VRQGYGQAGQYGQYSQQTQQADQASQYQNYTPQQQQYMQQQALLQQQQSVQQPGGWQGQVPQMPGYAAPGAPQGAAADSSSGTKRTASMFDPSHHQPRY
jgi:hypothetical protein